MKVLVLSSSTGEGHNSAAKAIYEELLSRNITTYFEDIMSFGNKKAEILIKSILNAIAVKTPSLFGIMYNAGAIVSNNIIKSPVYLANLMYANNLNKYIIENKIDKIICTHLFPMETLTYLKRNRNLKVNCYAILTDYTAIPFIEETELDYYFIPHKSLEREFIKKGIYKSKLYSLGIPISKKFNIKYNKKDARIFLNLPQNKKIILIMTGGIGCGNIIEILNVLVTKIDDDTKILVLVGKNNKLKKDIDVCFKNYDINTISFTGRVNLYMDASDILLSKPGGLSSTEAATKGIPLIHTMPIPGCETKNATFFHRKGMSIRVKNIKDLIKYTLEVLNSKKLQNKIINNQNKYINKNSTKDIIDIILK